MSLHRVQSGDRLILRRADDEADVEAVVERSHGWGEVVDVQTDEGEAVILVQPVWLVVVGASTRRRIAMMLLLIILLVLLLLGYGGYGRSRWGWGYGGDLGGLLVLIIVIYLVLQLAGRV